MHCIYFNADVHFLEKLFALPREKYFGKLYSPKLYLYKFKCATMKPVVSWKLTVNWRMLFMQARPEFCLLKFSMAVYRLHSGAGFGLLFLPLKTREDFFCAEQRI
jgi:hypothetical protein